MLTACASSKSSRDGYAPITKVYHESFDKVWRASQIALQKYPIRVNNIEKGVLETDFVKGFDVYKPPYETNISPAGMRYKIIVRTIKGRINQKEAVKVVIAKEVEKRRDFFADVEKIPSDGMEEKVIHYRIGREITIDNALEKAQEQMNN